MYKIEHPPAGTWDVVDRHGEPRYVVRHDGRGGWWSVCQPDRPEDCYVLAASKDLLDALKTILLNNELGEYESQKQGLPRLIEVCEKARAAIKKAEGR